MIRVQLYEIPGQADYRAGARPDWETVYEISFTRDELFPEED